MDRDVLYDKDINPYTDLLDEKDYRTIPGLAIIHPFTGVDYVELLQKPGP